MRYLRSLLGLGVVALLAACATPPAPYDYSAFRASKPKSILVLPPTNVSPDIRGTHGVMAAATGPLAESGYYVFPAALVSETFKNNGLVNPEEIHQVALHKLNDVFKADAVLYLKVKEYGTKYQILQSDTRVTVEAVLLDAKTGTQLWNGSATASSTENQNNSGLLGALIQAAVQQIASNFNEQDFEMAKISSSRLLSAGIPRGILYGPYSPHYTSEKGAGF